MLFLATGKCENESQCHAEQGGEEYLESGRQDKGDGVHREPEEGDGLLDDQVPLDVPVDLLAHDLAHLHGTEEAADCATVVSDMDVGAFVEGHHDGSEDTVHQHADGEGYAKLAPCELCRLECGGVYGGVTAVAGEGVSHGTEEGRDAGLEDDHRHGYGHAQEAPDYHAGKDAETRLVVGTLADAQGQAFTEGGENGELEEGHDVGVCCCGAAEPCEESRGGDEEGCQYDDDT